jgi:ankyrin repeat protein
MDDNERLFDLAKQNKWNEFIEYLHTHEDIDVNLRDDADNYLMNYAVLQNQEDVVVALLKADSKIDMVDQDGRSILFVPIKYDYIALLKSLLDKNKQTVGISIVDLKDKKSNIPLHYAINFKNTVAVGLLLDADSDVNVTDELGNNSLHLAIYTRNYEIVKRILQKNININARTKTGETVLHIAANFQLESILASILTFNINVNIQDYEHEFTALHYSVNLNNPKICSMLLDNGADPNLQDAIGNSALHYAVIEENYEVYMTLMLTDSTKRIINVNLYNIDGKIPLHVMLEKDLSSIEEYVEHLIPGSNLNFPDINGVTPLHLLTKNGLWKRFTNLLTIKKLNIFAEDNQKRRPVDYVNQKDLVEYIQLVTDSYLYVLRNSNVTWSMDWENKCNKELFKDNLTPDELKIVKSVIRLKDNGKNEGVDLCRKMVQKKILTLFEKKGNDCDQRSYPRKKDRQCINFSESNKLEFCTFIGSALDILIGLIFLLKKHQFACSTLSTQFMENNELCNYYKKIGIVTDTKCEFLNFEVVWVYQKMYLSTDFEKNFKKCINSVDKRLIIIPLGIQMRGGNHANYLIYDKQTKELERFEPYGSSPPYKFDYNPQLLDTMLERSFSNVEKDIKMIRPKDYLPKIGFQYFDAVESKTRNIGDPSGFCALWSIWWVDYRLTYPDIKRDKLVKQILHQIKTKNTPFKNTIRDYSINITNLRDLVLKEANMTINDWYNDQYDEEQAKIIITKIAEEIHDLS